MNIGFVVIVLSSLCLMGCASQPAPTASLQIPGSLLSCEAEPSSAGVKTDSSFADWILDLREAGADCRSKLSAVGGLLPK